MVRLTSISLSSLISLIVILSAVRRRLNSVRIVFFTVSLAVVMKIFTFFLNSVIGRIVVIRSFCFSGSRLTIGRSRALRVVFGN